MNKLLIILLSAVTLSGCARCTGEEEISIGTLVSIDHNYGQELSGSVSGCMFGFSGHIEGHQSVNYYMLIELADGSILPSVVSADKVRLIPGSSLEVKAQITYNVGKDFYIDTKSMIDSYKTPSRSKVTTLMRSNSIEEFSGSEKRFKIESIDLVIPMDSISRYIRVN